MPATTTELASMEDALRNLRHTWMSLKFRLDVNEDIVSYKLPGLSDFKNAVTSSRLLADDVKATLDRDDAEPPAKCASATSPAAQATVLASWDLLTHILSYRDVDDWFFTAPISRLVRAAYMTATIRKTAFRGSMGRSAVAWVCRTRLEQAVHSHARLDSALLSKEFKQVVQGGRCNTHVLSGAAAAAGAAGLVQRFAALGVRIESYVLCGAARLCDAGVRGALYGQAVTPRDVGSRAWLMLTQRVGEKLVECGDGGGALTWLSQLRQPPGRRWPPRYNLLLCQRAADCRQLRTLQFLLGPGLALFGPLDETWLDQGPRHDFLGWVGHALTLAEVATWGGDVSTVQWLVEHRAYKLSAKMMDVAAHRGHLPLLRWLRGKQCPCDEGSICSTYAGVPGSRCTGHILQWMRGCGWGEWSAADLTDMLRSTLMLHDTFDAPNYSIAEYLLREGAQWPVNLCDLLGTMKLDVLAENVTVLSGYNGWNEARLALFPALYARIKGRSRNWRRS
ncbi:hypothetical protein JKP88DRAFT_254212 [Tribonema minus]|uniref:Ankyrin repeat protein n=1 Tax=Tribonema minus TaxID=303371 RepID=A0A835Z3S5_9STRA|nr:hypothetical protein JKP88DRAFT_254212 [Tribonema minus]